MEEADPQRQRRGSRYFQTGSKPIRRSFPPQEAGWGAPHHTPKPRVPHLHSSREAERSLQVQGRRADGESTPHRLAPTQGSSQVASTNPNNMQSNNHHRADGGQGRAGARFEPWGWRAPQPEVGGFRVGGPYVPSWAPGPRPPTGMAFLTSSAHDGVPASSDSRWIAFSG